MTVRELRVVLLALVVISASAPVLSGPPMPDSVSPIVNGVTEQGWPSVGAMTFAMTGFGYMGSYCSGTLIAPQWVLTAAHCVLPSAEMPMSSKMASFFVGTYANAGGYGGQPAGDLYKADLFIAHPEYNAAWADNDIGLVHLAKPVTSTTPIPLYPKNMGDADIGKTVLYVGFGVTDGIDQNGGGTKRSGSMPIVDMGGHSYISGFEESGVCFGDSGGPGLYQEEGVWYVMGVNSAVYNESGDPCQGFAIQTRVDVYREWIESWVNAPTPRCDINHSMCDCQEGCQVDGTCDNLSCKTWSCAKVYACYKDCQGAMDCQLDCFLRGKEGVEDVWQNIAMCSYMMCQQVEDRDACMKTKCKSQLGQCIPMDSGDEDCETVQQCVKAAGDDDSEVLDCLNSGSSEAQQQWYTLSDCYQANGCVTFPEPVLGTKCGWKSCGVELDTCNPPVECAILGGECDSDQACAVTPRGKQDCFPSSGGEEGSECDPLTKSPLPCADGLVCVDLTGTATCSRYCAHDGHCPQGRCTLGLWSGVDVGACFCLDLDKDGACQPQDCDDNSAERSPLLPEVCGNGIDEDCDGKDTQCTEPTPDSDADVLAQDVATDVTPIQPVTEAPSSGGCQSSGAGNGSATLLMLVLVLALASARRSRESL